MNQAAYCLSAVTYLTHHSIEQLPAAVVFPANSTWKQQPSPKLLDCLQVAAVHRHCTAAEECAATRFHFVLLLLPFVPIISVLFISKISLI